MDAPSVGNARFQLLKQKLTSLITKNIKSFFTLHVSVFTGCHFWTCQNMFGNQSYKCINYWKACGRELLCIKIQQNRRKGWKN